MKTKEFIKKVESMGYSIKIIDNLTFVFNSNNSTVLSISNNRQYGIDCNYNTPATPELFSVAVEYAKKPIDERKEDKKYQVKAFGEILNINIFGTAMFLFEDKLKTKFTLKEIGQLKKRKDIPLDWNKVKLEEVD
ncbi:hypothetical protein ACR902_26765 [Klebsiella pneumoniae]